MLSQQVRNIKISSLSCKLKQLKSAKMRTVFICRMILLTSLSFVFASQANGKGKEKNNLPEKHVLMLGLPDNVKSNYFPKVMISEETGIAKNMIDREYNAIIMENIMASAKDACIFTPISTDEVSVDKWMGLIKIHGEGDACYSDVSLVPNDEYRHALDMADAEFLLVLNQHYLKWQEKPMRTLFHIVSYTLFDKDKNEVYRGNGYFASMNLETPDRLRKISGKTSSRIAATVIDKIVDLH